MKLFKNIEIIALLMALLMALLLSACSSSEKSITVEQAIVEYDLLYDLPKQALSFKDDVLPVLE
ncbi:MAG: hypothetical protein KAI17_27645, partial [Thiotrichaceae bacterium]|nr:hypothetical protein [Thiotrichaceae bacterium]